jgi:hypothetical protein
MNSSRFLIAITAANFAALLLSVTNLVRPAIAEDTITIPVVRARSLQIVDEHDRVRASLSVIPASTSASGVASPETVLLRLITERGRPSVKVGASEDKSGVSIAGPSGTRDSYAILEANAQSSSLRLRAEDGRDRVLLP